MNTYFPPEIGFSVSLSLVRITLGESGFDTSTRTVSKDWGDTKVLTSFPENPTRWVLLSPGHDDGRRCAEVLVQEYDEYVVQQPSQLLLLRLP